MWARLPFVGRIKAASSPKIVKITPYLNSPDLISRVQELLPLNESEIAKHGFVPYIKPSLIPNAGNGLFVKGRVKKDGVIAIYPGLVYSAFDPVWAASISNHYLLGCFDGMIIDAKFTGLSRLLFKSTLNRVRFGRSDWLENKIPLALGHYANNGLENSNARYQELNLSPGISGCNLHVEIEHDPQIRETRTVVLIATRDIQEEEVLVNYHELVE